MSSYEEQRLARILANEAFLNDLQVDTDKGALEQTTKRPASKKTPTLKPRKKARSTPPPRRLSSRLRGEDPENLYIVSDGGKLAVGTQPSTMSAPGTQDAAAAPQQLTQGSRERQKRFEEQVLDLGLASEDMNKAGAEYFETLARGAAGAGRPRATLNYSKRLGELKCDASIKVTPARIYSVAFAPSVPLVCAGDRDGNLGLYKLGADVEEAEATLELRPHVSTINVVQFQRDKLFSISYDGTARAMDLGRPGVFEKVYSTDALDQGVWLQHGQVLGDGKQLVVGLSNGDIACAEVAQGGKELWSLSAHEKKVQTVSASADGRTLATASLDRTIKLWDLRKMGSRGKAKPLATFESDKSVNCCLFNPTGTKMVAVTQANKVHLFSDLGQAAGGNLEPVHTINHDNRTGRFLAVFHAAWDPKNPDAFVLGSMAKPRRVEVYTAGPDNKMFLAMNLRSDAVSSVQSRSAFHPTQDMIACCSASGRMSLFRG